MGQKYTTQSTSGYNASPPPDDGTQVAANLITWAGVKTKLADVLKTFGEAINTALVSALDLSARAISTPDTAVASDHWKTLQVIGNTTITLSSAASMGAGYEVGIFNAGVGVVTVTPGTASDTINGVSASVTVSIKGTKIFRTNQALTGYNVVGGSDPQTVTATTSVVTPLVNSPADLNINTAGVNRWNIINATTNFQPATDNAASIGIPANRISAVFTPIIDSGTTGSGALKTNNGTTVLTWANTGAVGWGTGIANFGTITKRKTADESVTSSTALQDDDHLTFAIAANEEWVVDLQLHVSSSINLSNMGMKAAINGPAGATLDAVGQITTIDKNTSTLGSAMDFTTASFNNTDVGMRIKVWMLNGATPGNLTLQWCQSTSNGTALKLLKGSAMYATRVA